MCLAGSHMKASLTQSDPACWEDSGERCWGRLAAGLKNHISLVVDSGLSITDRGQVSLALVPLQPVVLCTMWCHFQPPAFPEVSKMAGKPWDMCPVPGQVSPPHLLGTHSVMFCQAYPHLHPQWQCRFSPHTSLPLLSLFSVVTGNPTTTK